MAPQMGARAVQQLRESAIEGSAAPVRIIGPHPCRTLWDTTQGRWGGGARGAREAATAMIPRSLGGDRSIEERRRASRVLRIPEPRE